VRQTTPSSYTYYRMPIQPMAPGPCRLTTLSQDAFEGMFGDTIDQ
jgi:hypothetical protein